MSDAATPHKIEIIYQDNGLLVVEKPSGMMVHRSADSQPGDVFLLQSLRDQIGQRVYPIHRLDRPVSGLIVFGTDPSSAAKLQEALIQGEKRYLALVRGCCATEWEEDKPLTNDSGVVQEAKTHFVSLSSGKYCSLVEARLVTGRRHQIRRHLAHKGHQILGDVRHGKGRLNQFYRDHYQLNRIFLHSWSLSFGWSGKSLELISRLGPDLLAVLDKLSLEGVLDMSHFETTLSQKIGLQRISI